MRRHELTEEQFKKIEALLPGTKGHVGVTEKIIENFLMLFIGYLKPERHGEIYLKDMGIGRTFIDDFLAGKNRCFREDFSSFITRCRYGIFSVRWKYY